MCRRKILHYTACDCRHQSGTTVFCRAARRAPNGMPHAPCDHVQDTVEAREDRNASICSHCIRKLREGSFAVRQWVDSAAGRAANG